MPTPKRHSTTRLLYRVPTVRIFALGVREFATTRDTESGTTTSVAFRAGMKSISFAVLNYPMTEIV